MPTIDDVYYLITITNYTPTQRQCKMELAALVREPSEI